MVVITKIVDFLSNYEVEDKNQRSNLLGKSYNQENKKLQKFNQKELDELQDEQKGYNEMFGGIKPSHMIYLMVLGAVGALLAYSLDLTVFEINSRKYLSA